MFLHPRVGIIKQSWTRDHMGQNGKPATPFTPAEETYAAPES